MNSFGNVKPFRARPELLLHQNVPKPLHGLAPRVVLGQDWWDQTRRAAYRSTGFRCAACGRHQDELPQPWCVLEAHEIYDINYVQGRAVYVEAVPLCHWCHAFIHDGKLMIDRQKGLITQAFFDEVMAHGKAVLARIEKVKRKLNANIIIE